MRLHDYPASPNCFKVRLALAELDIPYERVHVDIFGGDTLTEDFGTKNLMRLTPVLELDDGELLTESNAIVLYLTEGTDLLPADRIERAHVHRWLFYEQSRVFPIIGQLRVLLQTGRLAPDSDEARRQKRMGIGAAGMVAAHLEGREWVVGDCFSAADICLYGYLHAAPAAGIDTTRMPALQAWLDRVRARPRHVADLQDLPDNARPGQSKSVYDLLGVFD